MSTETPTPAAPIMDPQVRQQLLDAARGKHRTPAEPVAMGIRYRTPAAAAQPTPVDRRPLWMMIAPTGVLQEIARTDRRPRTKTVPPAEVAEVPTPPVPTPAKRRTPRKTIPTTAAPAGGGARPQPGVRVLASYDAFACETCGDRYHRRFTDHECGPLTPVTVTVTTKPAAGPA